MEKTTFSRRRWMNLMNIGWRRICRMRWNIERRYLIITCYWLFDNLLLFRSNVSLLWSLSLTRSMSGTQTWGLTSSSPCSRLLLPRPMFLNHPPAAPPSPPPPTYCFIQFSYPTQYSASSSAVSCSVSPNLWFLLNLALELVKAMNNWFCTREWIWRQTMTLKWKVLIICLKS